VPGITRWRGAIFALFFVGGLSMGSWTSRMPAVAEDLGVSLGQLGLLISISALGAITGLLVVNHVVELLDERRTAVLAVIVAGLAFASFGLATAVFGNFVLSAIALFLFALGISSSNIILNLEAAAIDRQTGRTLMLMFHATWSIGAFAGAGLGALASAFDVSLAVQLPATAAFVLITSLVAISLFPAIRTPEATRTATSFGERMRVWTEPRTLAIGVIVLAASFNESTANNWLALTMVRGFSWDAAPAAAMLTIFTASVIVGRLLGGRLIDRFGRVVVLRSAFGLVMAGLLLVITVPLPFAIVGGVVLWGLGASVGYPMGVSAAADDPHNAGARVSAVATVASVSSLLGPSVIGLVANGIGLPHALVVTAIVVTIGFVVAGAVRKPISVGATRVTV
jgi:predicted MFS family arabinose efflux permease